MYLYIIDTVPRTWTNLSSHSIRHIFDNHTKAVRSRTPVFIGRGMIACNTPALQPWCDGVRNATASQVNDEVLG